MRCYAVGDIQGCLDPLMCLLDKVGFDPQQDQLWCVGDLVNRGPKSLQTLRFLYGIKDSVISVLGNHDLHLLACYFDPSRLKRKDTLIEILQAPDCEVLMEWLLSLPLMHYDEPRKIAMVHAGIAPQWSIQQALGYAKEVQTILSTPALRPVYFSHMYGNQPDTWDESLQGPERWRMITNYFTRMRFISPNGQLEFTSKEGLDTAPEGYYPWFFIPKRKVQEEQIIFGHWAALEGACVVPNIVALDTGCVWGNAMTLYNIDTQEKHLCDCKQ
ncbi:symmetrical bis(5'-nucleosyl)-tetraphosphatase [Pseudomonas sp. F1_0610]|uniref:symmetrical bis(5'-nucleosyl)-tetraphosphatase n=1 Tax=Pseudomonas sp. F1_0610 TaxID=3114284 RepID=UPI0039C17282